jgi:hypothetical protein
MNADIDSQKVVIFSSETKRTPSSKGADLLGDTPGGVVTVGTLRKSVAELMPGLGAIIEDLKGKAGALGLKEVSVALSVNAKGTVGFLGTGTEIGGTASMRLQFKTD